MFSEEFRQAISSANSVMILTGAGVSKESGLDTFRDAGGHWSRYNPIELASPQGFAADPKLVWEWYSARKEKALAAEPNPGHFAITEMEQIFPNFSLFTQNVDRLHQKAGSKKVHELHGNIMSAHCNNCGLVYMNEIDITQGLPHCAVCGGYARPSVVWFGEQLPEEILEKAINFTKSVDIFFTIGTSAEVYPAAHLPHLAKESGAFVVEVNPNETSFTRFADISFRNPSGEILPKILNLIKEVKSYG